MVFYKAYTDKNINSKIEVLKDELIEQNSIELICLNDYELFSNFQPIELSVENVKIENNRMFEKYN